MSKTLTEEHRQKLRDAANNRAARMKAAKAELAQIVVTQHDIEVSTPKKLTFTRSKSPAAAPKPDATAEAFNTDKLIDNLESSLSELEDEFDALAGPEWEIAEVKHVRYSTKIGTVLFEAGGREIVTTAQVYDLADKHKVLRLLAHATAFITEHGDELGLGSEVGTWPSARKSA